MCFYFIIGTKFTELSTVNSFCIWEYYYYYYLADLYKLTAEMLGEGSYAKVQGALSLQTGKEYAVKVRKAPQFSFWLKALLFKNVISSMKASYKKPVINYTNN